jgi:hypothetical protein
MATVLGIGSFTLSPSVTQTTVVMANCKPTSVVTFSATTPHAANSIPLMSIVPGAGQFIVNHENNSQTDRMFDFAVFG